MTNGRDQIDQDALAADWGLALEAEGANGVPGAPGDGGFEVSEAAAAQWSAMGGEENGGFQGGKGGAERILNQEEIDSLLGFSLADVSLKIGRASCRER